MVTVAPANLTPVEVDPNPQSRSNNSAKPKLSGMEMQRIQQAIETLQSQNFVDPDEICTICMEDVSEVRSNMKLPCGELGRFSTLLISIVAGHIFHFRCVVPWLQQGGTCPCCRASIIQGLGEEDEEDKEEWGDGGELAGLPTELQALMQSVPPEQQVQMMQAFFHMIQEDADNEEGDF